MIARRLHVAPRSLRATIGSQCRMSGGLKQAILAYNCRFLAGATDRKAGNFAVASPEPQDKPRRTVFPRRCRIPDPFGDADTTPWSCAFESTALMLT